MQATQQSVKTLPLFRKDLRLYRGPNDPDGSPTYNLLDPISGQYYKINWKESLIFKCLKPNMSSEQLAENVNHISTLKVAPQDIERFFKQCAELNLLRLPRTSEYYQTRYDKRQVNIWYWILQHYLY